MKIQSMLHKPKVTFIIGLAGSGKTTLLKEIPHDEEFEEGFWLNDLALEANHTQVLAHLNAGKHCVISERNLMRKEPREEYACRLARDAPLADVCWMFFENDLDSANHNCNWRSTKIGDPSGDFHVDQNKMDTQTYNTPAGVTAIPIIRATGLSANEAASHVQNITTRLPAGSGSCD